MTTQHNDSKEAQESRELTEAEADTVQGGVTKPEAAVALGGQSVGSITLDEGQGLSPDFRKPGLSSKARHSAMMATVNNIR